MPRSKDVKGKGKARDDAERDPQPPSIRSTFAPARAVIDQVRKAASGMTSSSSSRAIGTARRSTSYRARDAPVQGHSSRLSDQDYDRTMMERGLFSGRTGTNILDPSANEDNRMSTVIGQGIDITSLDARFLASQSVRVKSHGF
ncbi:hypothetical protein DV735_g2279, partial [Chaetothyriales sp. CBS 134920]